MTKKKLLKKQPFKDKSAIICGASEGLGLATAKEFVKLGGSVCINARREEKLNSAKSELETLISDESQYIESISCDATEMIKLKPLIEEFIKKRGVPDYLINVVGMAMPEYIENLSLEDFKKQMDVNYYGQVVPTLILLPHFIERRKGHISFVSSAGAFLGLIGYAAYTPTKAALLGFAEVLKNELSPYKIDISVILPGDMDTEGFKRENESKPEENKIISEKSKLMPPEEVAESFVEGILDKDFYITPGDVGFLFWAKRHLPKLVFNILDKDLKKARKKLGKNTDY
ncbi:MAG: SDR family oxidoreductase [Promethearchaeati archaeon]